MGFEGLPDVHPGSHAQRVEDDVNRRPVGQMRHVLIGQDHGDHALVPVAASHLVAHHQLALEGDPDAHHLGDAGLQVGALGGRESA